PELAQRGEHFDLVTDQTAAHDPLNGYVPSGLDVEAAAALRASGPEEYVRRARESIAAHVRGLLDYVRAGSYVFDYGNNLRGEAAEGGVEEAFTYPGFVPAYIRPLFCEGIGPFRWAALSGEADDIAAIDEALRELFPEDSALQRWLSLAPERGAFQGLPARICWLGYGGRAPAGLAINELVRSGRVKAPVVIGRDHLDAGPVASPFRETEAMRDGSGALARLVPHRGSAAPLRGSELREVEHGENACVLAEGGRIVATGRMDDLGALPGDVLELDGRGLSAIPGLVDCHAHACFAGDRVG